METAILIVDDNVEIIEFLSDNLKSKYSVLTALNGAAAMEIIEKDPVHLIVSDIMMPVMDGFELCKKIKSSLHYCHIPIILLTAKKTLDSRIEGLETGADAYIDKPFSPKHLQVQIENLLANRNKLKSFFANSCVANPTVFFCLLMPNAVTTISESCFVSLANGTLITDLLLTLTV